VRIGRSPLGLGLVLRLGLMLKEMGSMTRVNVGFKIRIRVKVTS
jgi:hypothetical protein